MVIKPVVFISSTSDLRLARDLVGKVLYSMGYEPIWQDIAATDGGELLEILRDRIRPCQMMIQLVGNRYGAEPPYPSPEFGRVSYTQFEAMYSERQGKKVVYHFLTGDFPTDAISAEPQELADLQSEYRQRIVAINKLHQANINSPQDLELSIRRIQDELASVRKLSDFRFGKLLWLIGGSLAGLAAIAILTVGGFYLLHSRQREQISKIDLQIARGVDQSGQLDRIEKLLSAQKQANPQAVPTLSAADQAILDQAKKQGDLKTRAAASVLQPDAQTDALLDQLRAQQTAEQFDLAMLEGKRWYFDKLRLFDKSIPFFEQAISLRPDSIDARSIACSAHNYARLGNLIIHRQRAIEICEGTLKLVAPGSADWARTQNKIAIAWCDMPTGDKGENLRRAIGAYEAALTVRTREADPRGWAAIQKNLGAAWSDMPTGDKGENLRKAFAAYKAALTVFTREADSSGWAMTQINLGAAWSEMPTGDKGENLCKAIAAYEAVLTVFTKEADPSDWAMTQNNIGDAWVGMPTGDKEENLYKAISAQEAALTVFTEEGDPSDWAMVQNDLGMALARMADVKGEDRAAWLSRAIACDKAALIVRTTDAFPNEHAETEKNLAIHRKSYEATAGAATQPFEKITPGE